ncbi:acyltransferase family protein [Hymenobacter sp. J193]|uniref:acyltransferase family protein n=1 Tax=Hymenobacter sp. J193 TaxID=2898429 RepID=UPI0021512FAF|nr:acyltransferase family protein [Hymenobacter sp. J193]MCR5886657.1 acyltransferase family protein [Hymenobacter sp. J193]
MPPALPQERYFALDGLRAVMMLLGVVLHSAQPYATWTFSIYTAFHDTAHTFVLSGLAFLLHLFRMPAFFVMAGFFGSVIWHARGTRALLRNRVKRVLLPLVLSWVVLFPLIVLSAAFTVLGGPKGVAHIVQQLHSGALLAKNNLTFSQLLMQMGLVHLWFLYFLMLFYGAITLLLRGLRQLPQKIKNLADNSFKQIMLQPAGVVLLAAITGLTMVPMRPANKVTTGIEGTHAFLPPIAILVAYFVFFVFGWLLFRHKHLLTRLRDRAWLYTSLGLGAAGLYAWLILHPPVAKPHLLQVAVAAPAIWLLSLGSIGLAMRYFRKPTGLFQYLSEASYWVYLVHVPLTLLLPGLLIDLPLPALLKFLLTWAGATGISLLTYQYWVRTTPLGGWLNGRRLAPYAFWSGFRKSEKPAATPIEAGSLI